MWTRGKDIEQPGRFAYELFSSSGTPIHRQGGFTTAHDADRAAEEAQRQQMVREADPALYEEMTQVGRRNIAMLTIAPTGTTSLMSQTTSGIEPVFRPVYKRRRKVNPTDKNVKITFTDEVGDSWEEYNVFHHKFLTWLQVTGYDLSLDTPLARAR